MMTLELLSQGWWNWIVAVSFQLSVLVLLLALLDRAFGARLTPPFRLGLWSLVLLKVFIPPGWTTPISLTHSTIGTWTARVVDVAEVPPAISLFLLGAWFLGIVAGGVLTVRRLLVVRRVMEADLRRHPIPAALARQVDDVRREIGLDRAVRVVLTERIATPAVIGIRRPIVFLPVESFAALDRTAQRHVLLHEMMHVARGDLAFQFLATVVGIVFWFNPLLTMCRSRLIDMQELCCDIAVAAHLQDDAVAYRGTLLAVASRLVAPPHADAAAHFGLLGRPGRIAERLRLLENPPRRPGTLHGYGPATAIFMLALKLTVLPMGA